MANRLDIIVFGATGFTGKHTLPFIYNLTKLEDRNLTWGIAGRSESKLQAILKEAATKIGIENLDVPIILADVSNEDSISAMARKARVIINCCGPYQLYGEIVVKACVANGTHVLDVTAEMQFIDLMRLKYRQAATETGSYIVSACGIDCVPSDLGVVFLENNFKGTLNSVEVFASGIDESEWFSGSIANYGTYHSIILMLGNLREKFSIQKKLNLSPLPNLTPKLSLRLPFPSKNPSKRWLIPLPSADRDIVLNSQRYFYENDKTRRPIQSNIYVAFGSFFLFLIAAILAPVVILVCQFQFTRHFLLKHPRICTLGYFSHNEPSEENVEKSSYKLDLYGEGWKEKLSDGSDQYSSPPNKSILARISGKNPGYHFTCLSVTLCALMILTEKDKLPKKGGVYTTAAMFSKTSLVQQLQNHGVKYEIISINEL